MATSAAGLAAGLLWPQGLGAERQADDPVTREIAAIVARVQPPAIPARDIDVRTHGAKGDGTTDCTAAFAAAIAAAATAGGGRVVVPAGRFLSGAIHLKSHVGLHLEAGATIAFSRDTRQYPIVFTRWEGVELMNYSPFIYAFEQTDIAITGAGTLDGQADDTHWWPWKGTSLGLNGPDASLNRSTVAPSANNQNAARTRLLDFGARGVPVAERVFGEGGYLRPNFIQPYRCQRVRIEGVTIINSPMWEIHPVLCRDVTVRGVTINSHGPNNDGCDPESCDGVIIERCVFDTGDDCIAIKSGRNNDGRRVNVPSQNMVIRDCTMKDGHGGVVIGSEISGGARNIYAERCHMDSPQLDRALRLKTNSVRGGTIERVVMRDITVGQVKEAIVTIDFTYEEGNAGTFPPTVRDVVVERVTSQKSKYGMLLRGYANAPIQNVRVTDCTFAGVASGDLLEHVQDVVLTRVSYDGRVRNERITKGGGARP